MSSFLVSSPEDLAKCVHLDEKEVNKRVQAEEVCAKRILEIQETMFGQPSSSARVKFRRLVELFDTWEWLDLQEVLENADVNLPDVTTTSSVAGGLQGPGTKWCREYSFFVVAGLVCLFLIGYLLTCFV